MFVKVIEILLIIIFINYSQTAQPQKNNISKNKPQAKLNQGNNIAKNIPQANQWTNIKKSKPQTKLNQGINTQNKAKTTLNKRNNLVKNNVQIDQRNSIAKNKQQTNLKQKNNMLMKIPQPSLAIKTPKNIQAKQKNNKPQTNEWNNISKNNLQINQFNNIPNNIPQINPESSVSSKINPGNDMAKYMSQKNESNNITKNKSQFNRDGVKNKKWKFQDYLKKFEPKTIWEQIDKQRKYNGRQITNEEQTEIMLRGIDPTDEIMKLKIEDGDPKMIVQPDGRRGWKPVPGLHWYEKDKFQLRRRLYELMKQAIYQTRNKMITMQIYREKYKSSALYKMGFLMNKADNAAKTFGKFSFRAFRNCLLKREAIDRPPLFDLLSTNERQLNLWFNVEIIVDLIKKNDLICKEIFQNHKGRRQKLFDAAFIN